MNELVAVGTLVQPFYTFYIAQRLIGIELSRVREVSPHLPTTPVPQAPPAVRGLSNLRSRIHLVLDVRALMGSSTTECTPASRFVILKPEFGQDIALLVEQGSDIAHVRPDQIEAAGVTDDAQAAIRSSIIAGVCKLDRELMMMIDPQKLIDAVTSLLR